MEQAAITLFKVGLKISVVLTAVIAFVGILSLTGRMIFTNVNGNVLNDGLAIIQIWLPFDLSVVMLWATIAGASYFSYRLTMIAFNLINSTLTD